MDAIKRELDELPVVIETDIDDKTISKMILDSPDGTVFVVNENSVFKGIITEGDYIRYMEDENDSLKVNTNCKFVYDNQDTMKEIAFIHMEYKNIRTIPVLDSDKKIIYAYSFKLELIKIYYDLLIKFFEIKANNIIDEYFNKNNYTNIAIWGANELSVLIGNELLKCEKLKNICIYDNIKDFKVNMFKCDVQVYLVESIEDIINNKKLDLIIINDFSTRLYLINYHDIRLKLMNTFLDDMYRNIYIIKSKLTDESLEKFFKKLSELGIFLLGLNSYNVNFSQSKLNQIEYMSKLNLYNFETIYSEFGKEYALEFSECFCKRVPFNYKSKFINYANGRRITLNQPEIYDNTIYLIGNCLATSIFAEDKYTIGSYLQNILLQNNFKFIYRVEAIQEDVYYDRIYSLEKYIDLKLGDIIIFFGKKLSNIQHYIDVTKQFNKLYQQEDFFLDSPAHCNHKGYKIIAEEIFKYLNENYFNKKETEVCCEREKICLDMDNVEKDKPNRKVFENNRELIKYLEYIDKQKVRGGGIEKIGSIVMNCNPFTLGHRYLIETAVKEVDWLYIFVVEEDKSMFSFEDRFELVKRNTEDLKNVTVIPSGNFIISTATFPGYFTKDTPTSVKIDTSTDVEVFGQHIAPALNINIRFVGDEPLDVVTNQYNRSMKEILPKYNVEVKVIERKEIDGEIISASKVRELLKEGKIEDTKKFLTETTFEYIDKLYRDGVQFIQN